MPNPPALPAEHPGLRNLIGDALVAAGGIPDTIPVVVTAQAGVLADAVLTALPDLLATHTRHLAGLIHDATRADRDRNPGPGPQSNRNYARRGGMISARQVLDRHADQLDQQTPGDAAQAADQPVPAVGQRWTHRPGLDPRTVTITRVWDDKLGRTAVAVTWGDRGQYGTAMPLGVFHHAYEQGDYCPTCQTNADAARTAAEQNAGGEQK